MRPIERVVALWKSGLITSEQVVTWADRELLQQNCSSQEVLDLSLEGPARCVRMPEFELPAGKIKLCFVTEFTLRAVATDISSDESVLHFCRWCARAAMGEELELPEVAFGYQVEHLLFDCENPQATLEYARVELSRVLPGYATVVASFLKEMPDPALHPTVYSGLGMLISADEFKR